MSGRCVFPFPAVLGQDNIKKALLWNVVNPSIGGVLISGEKGTAKSTLVRGLAAVAPFIEVVDLPLNTTEDRLIGTISMERAVKEGRKCFEPGILHRAHKNILYVDEVNLLSEHLVNSLLEAAASGVNIVEREGISYSHPSSFILVGTMNPEEGMLRPQFTDRFGLYVEAGGCRELEQRIEIIKRRLAYERNPVEYIEKWKEHSGEIAENIKNAREKLGCLRVSENVMKLAAQIAAEGNCAGHRAEIAVLEASRAIAALKGNEDVSLEDIKEAAELALPHRMREKTPSFSSSPEENRDEDREPEKGKENTPGESEQERQDGKEEARSEGGNKSQAGSEAREGSGDDSGTESEAPESGQDEQEENVDEAEGEFDIKPLVMSPVDKKKRSGSGKRNRTLSASIQGRYAGYKFPKDKVRDIAFDATFRAAAPFQKDRERDGVAIAISRQDLREKIRERRTGSAILFLVDASGSMGANKRMKAVKGAILSLLRDAYQKRDRVGMIAFRKNSAELLLGITRSVELAQKKLSELPTGGKTPLSAGLSMGYEIIKAAKRREPDIMPLIVLVSDGRCNTSIREENPMKEALGFAEKFAFEGIKALVIDTESGFVKLEMAREIADKMGAEYVKLDELGAAAIENVVKSVI